MIDYFADLHIHIGRTSRGEPVKVTASSKLVFHRILEEASGRKGLDVIAIVDCASVGVLRDMRALLDQGEMTSQPGGGLLFRDRLVLFPAAEVEVAAGRGEAHYLCYFPHYDAIERFSREVRPFVTNPLLSSQRARLTSGDLLEITLGLGGIFVPAHVFTPHKGFYGRAADRLTDVFAPDQAAGIPAIELGLSADTAMASRVSELDSKSFLSNSDAHSLPKIAREYNRIRAADKSFAAFGDALQGRRGGVVANYGLDPRLGKYHRTFCPDCEKRVALTPERICPDCKGRRLTVGVADRLEEVADRPGGKEAAGRPPYVHQVPLEFIPGVGPKTLEELLRRFDTEMNVLHRASPEELARAVGEELARRIVAARSGALTIRDGAGGIYGKVESGRSGT